ncbi:MAG: adenosylhomocysteinase, partial [Chloroflexota bacterium]|nr:adenosylhomocysteinase [Chloroflexota bacterium]
RGIASRFRGMGGLVAIVEIDPIRAIEALMDGYQVMSSLDAAAWGDVFITATGNFHIFRREHFERMRDGALLANSGHFDDEIDLPTLAEMAGGRCRELRRDVQEYDLGGRKVYVLAEGRLVNLAAAEGHPAAVMDMSFANQALGVEHVLRNHASLSPQVYTVPVEIDREVARLKLAALGVTIDEMTPEQVKYAASWQQGT